MNKPTGLMSNGRNPVFDIRIHVADPEAHVMPNGRLYIYGSLDEVLGQFSSTKYHVFSTNNMTDWVDHGEAFSIQDVHWQDDADSHNYPGTMDWTAEPTPFMRNVAEIWGGNAEADATPKKELNSKLLFAPDAIEKDGKFYLYFCCDDNSEGVAKAESPNGPFQDAERLKCNGIDPAIFIDDDGQAYFYWGQFSLNGARLKENMTELDEGSILYGLITEQQHFFHEGGSMRKRGDTYYLVYSNMQRGRPNALGYATSKSPLGPFVYQGIIVDNSDCDPASWNNHGSIEAFNGQWYVFYHRNSQCSPSMRRMCIEPIYFDSQGLIREVEQTSQGAGKPFGTGEQVPFYRACQIMGQCSLTPDDEAGEVLAGLRSDDSAVFKYFHFEQAPETVSLSVRGEGQAIIKSKDSTLAELDIKGEKTVKTLNNRLVGKQSIEVIFTKVSEGFQAIAIEFA